MLFQVELFALLFAPVIAYLAAALFFGFLGNQEDEKLLPTVSTNPHLRRGHKV